MRWFGLASAIVIASSVFATRGLAVVACTPPQTGCIVCANGQFACAGPPTGGGGGPVILLRPEDRSNPDIFKDLGKGFGAEKVLKDLKEPPANSAATFRGL